jgi:hypothetical protein
VSSVGFSHTRGESSVLPGKRASRQTVCSRPFREATGNIFLAACEPVEFAFAAVLTNLIQEQKT